METRALIAVAALAFTGCAVLKPQAVQAELEHISHPLAGWPAGGKYDEDSLTQVNTLLRWDIGGVTVENGLGYVVKDGGFYGPRLTYTGRISKEFRFSKGAQ